MKPEDVLGAVLRGVLTSRPRSRARTLRRLGHGQLLSTRNIVTAAAAAWGIYEAWQSGQPQDVAGPAGSAPPSPTPASLPVPTAGKSEPAAPMPPPLPTPGASGRAVAAPGAPPAPPADDHGFPRELARAIRLLIAAARADGELKPEEGALIARHAAEAGAEALVRAELQQHRNVAEIVGGVTDPGIAAELYTLAFAVLRADEDLGSDERRWLGELEALLKLDPPTARRLEEAVASGIAEEGAPGPAQ